MYLLGTHLLTFLISLLSVQYMNECACLDLHLSVLEWLQIILSFKSFLLCIVECKEAPLFVCVDLSLITLLNSLTLRVIVWLLRIFFWPLYYMQMRSGFSPTPCSLPILILLAWLGLLALNWKEAVTADPLRPDLSGPVPYFSPLHTVVFSLPNAVTL